MTLLRKKVEGHTSFEKVGVIYGLFDNLLCGCI